MCTGKHPFTASNEGALIRKILKGVYDPPTGFSKPLLDLVAACLTYDQNKRPASNALLRICATKAKALGISLKPPTDQETQDMAVYDVTTPQIDQHAAMQHPLDIPRTDQQAGIQQAGRQPVLLF